MPITTSFLDTCRTAIALLPELTTFRTAYAAYDTAAHNDKGLCWQRVYNDATPASSPAYRLRKAIRNTVFSLADATVSSMEREEAYRTLVAQYVPKPERPMSAPDEEAALQSLLLRSHLS